MERASVQQYSTSSSIGLRVSRIQSSSTALGVVTTHEHLIDCIAAILSDFSYSDRDHRVQQLEWEISTPKLPASIKNPSSLPVKLEQIILSQDYKPLIGTVAVHNLAVNKSVIARFTFDNWNTIADVDATYNDDLC